MTRRADPNLIGGLRGSEPRRVVEVEISRPLPHVSAVDEADGRRYRRAVSLVRLQGQPLGMVELELPEDGLCPDRYAGIVWAQLGPAIAGRLSTGGGREVSGLTASGLPCDALPCGRERAGASSDPDIAVVVATRDRPAQLRKCLRSLLGLDYARFEIIVVDSAPRRAVADIVAEFRASPIRLRYVRSERPGLGLAHNVGVSLADAPIIAFTDDDVVADKLWLRGIADAFGLFDDVGCVTGLIVPAELQTPTQVIFESYFAFGKGFTRSVFDLSQHRQRHPLYPYAAGTFGSGANMAFRTSALRGIGLFDPALGAGTKARGGDDLAAFLAIIMAGYKIVYEPAAIVRHHHHKEPESLRKQAFGYGVGLTAYLTRAMIESPKRIVDVGPKIPHGLIEVLHPRSSKNGRAAGSRPWSMRLYESAGMLYGPIAYLSSLRHRRGAGA